MLRITFAKFELNVAPLASSGYDMQTDREMEIKARWWEPLVPVLITDNFTWLHTAHISNSRSNYHSVFILVCSSPAAGMLRSHEDEDKLAQWLPVCHDDCTINVVVIISSIISTISCSCCNISVRRVEEVKYRWRQQHCISSPAAGWNTSRHESTLVLSWCLFWVLADDLPTWFLTRNCHWSHCVRDWLAMHQPLQVHVRQTGCLINRQCTQQMPWELKLMPVHGFALNLIWWCNKGCFPAFEPLWDIWTFAEPSCHYCVGTWTSLNIHLMLYISIDYRPVAKLIELHWQNNIYNNITTVTLLCCCPVAMIT